jgi:hypothetical protein
VDHVTVDDAGFYRCRVDFKTAQTRNALIHLNIIGESKPMQKL